QFTTKVYSPGVFTTRVAVICTAKLSPPPPGKAVFPLVKSPSTPSTKFTVAYVLVVVAPAFCPPRRLMALWRYPCPANGNAAVELTRRALNPGAATPIGEGWLTVAVRVVEPERLV